MSTQIDTRAVELEWRDGSFEEGVKKTLSTLKNLDSALDLKNASKGFDAISKAANSVSLSSIQESLDQITNKFSVMGTVADTAIRKFTKDSIDKAFKTIKSIPDNFLIGPMKQGFAEYAEELTSVQTLTNATNKPIDVVRASLDKLNEYADRTIYSFSDMTSAMSKFTNAGIDLEPAEKAIRGVSNVAAYAGAGTRQASSAMYNFSQALSTGYMGITDWNSISNTAQVVTTDFKQALLDVGVGMKTLTKTEEGYVTTTTNANGKVSDAFNLTKGWRESLSHQWMTTEVMTQALEIFSTDVRTLTEAEKAEYEEKLRGLGLSQEQIEKYEQIGIKAADAAQEVKTFDQLIDVTKESIGSGWAKTWRLIFGDLDEAKKLFTGASRALDSVISKVADWRNAIVQGWRDAGGRDALINTVASAWNTLITILERVTKAIRAILGPLTGAVFAQISNGILLVFQGIGSLVSNVENFEQGIGGLAVIARVLGNAFTAVASIAIPPLAAGLSVVYNAVMLLFGIFGRLMRWIYNIVDLGLKPLKSNLEGIVKVITNVSKAFADKLNGAMHKITVAFREFDFLHFSRTSWLREWLHKTFGVLFDLGSRISSIGKDVKQKLGSILNSVIAALKSGWSTISQIFGNIGQTVKSLISNIRINLDPFISSLSKVWSTIKTQLSGVANTLLDLGKAALGEIRGKLTPAFDGFSKIAKPIGDVLKKVSQAFTDFAGKALTKAAEKLGDLSKWLGTVGDALSNFATRVKQGTSVFSPFIKVVNTAKNAVVGFVKSLDISGKLKTVKAALTSAKDVIANAFNLHVDPKGFINDIKTAFSNIKNYITNNGLFKGSLMDKFGDLRSVGSMAIKGLSDAFGKNVDIKGFATSIGSALKIARKQFADFVDKSIPENLKIAKAQFQSFSTDFLKSAKTNVPKALNVLKDVIKDIPGTVEKIKNVFNDWKANFEIPEWLQKIIDKFKEFADQHPTIKGMVETITNFGKAIQDFGKSITDAISTKFGSFINFFKDMADKVSNFTGKFEGLKETIKTTITELINKGKELISKINWSKVFDTVKMAAGAVGLGVIIYNVKNFLETLSGTAETLTESLSSVPEALSEAITSVSETIATVGEAKATELKAEAFKSMAQGLLIVAGALMVISQIPPEGLYRALAVTVIIGLVAKALLLSLGAFNDAKAAVAEAAADAATVGQGITNVANILKGPLTILAKGLARAATFISLGVFIVAIGVTITMIVNAFKGLAENETVLNNSKRAMWTLTGIMTELLVFSVALAVLNGAWKGANTGAAFTILSIGITINLLVRVVQMLAMTPWNMAKQGLKALTILMFDLAVFAIAVSTLGSKFSEMGVALLALSASMIILTGVVKLLGGIKETELKQGLLAVTVLSLILFLLADLMMVVEAMGGVVTIGRLADGLVKMATAIAVLGLVAGVLSKFDSTELKNAAIVIIELMVALSVCMAVLLKVGKQGLSAVMAINDLVGCLLLFAAAVAVLGGTAIILSFFIDQLWPVLGFLGLLAVGILAFLAAAAFISTVLAPGIEVLGTFLAAIGALATGLGIFIASLVVFMVAIIAFGDQFVDAVIAIGQKINGRKQEFIDAIANLIEGVVGGIVLGLAGAIDELIVACDQVAKSLAEHLPTIVWNLIVACVLGVINIVKAIMDAIAKAFPGVWESVQVGIWTGIDKLSSMGHGILSKLEGFIGKIFQWLGEKLKDVPFIGSAIQELGDDMVKKSEANAKKAAEAASRTYAVTTQWETGAVTMAAENQMNAIEGTVTTKGESVAQASGTAATNASNAWGNNFNIQGNTENAFINTEGVVNQYGQTMPVDIGAIAQNGTNAFGTNFDISSVAGTEIGDMTAMLQGGSVDVENIMSQMSASGAAAATNTDAYASAGTNNVSEFIAAAVTESDASADQVTSMLQELGYAVPEGFSEGIVAKKDQGKQAVSTAMTEAIESGRLALDSHSPSVVFDQMGQDSMGGYAQGVQTGAAGAGAALTTAFTTMIDSIKASLPQFETGATDIMNGLEKNITSGGPKLNAAMLKVIEGILTTIRHKSRDFYTRGVELIRNFEQGMSSRSGGAHSAAAGVASSALSGLDTQQNAAYQVGAYMGEGFKNGILSKANEIAQAAASVASTAIAAAQKASEQKSPSKAFFRIGAYDGQGLINGVYSTEDAVYDAGWDLGYAALVGTMSMMDRVTAYLEDNPDFQPTITPVLDLSDLRADADRLKSFIGDILLPTDSIAASMEYRSRENQNLVDTINRQNTLLGDILTKLNQGNLLDPNRIYEAVRIGASDSHPSIVANNREVTRYFKEIGVAFSG